MFTWQREPWSVDASICLERHKVPSICRANTRYAVLPVSESLRFVPFLYISAISKPPFKMGYAHLCSSMLNNLVAYVFFNQGLHRPRDSPVFLRETRPEFPRRPRRRRQRRGLRGVEAAAGRVLRGRRRLLLRAHRWGPAGEAPTSLNFVELHVEVLKESHGEVHGELHVEVFPNGVISRHFMRALCACDLAID